MAFFDTDYDRMELENRIEVGSASVIYTARRVSPRVPGNPWSGVTLMPGWVLPGGERTTDYEVALRVAKNMNRYIDAWITRK